MDKSLWWCHDILTVRAKTTAAMFDAMGRIKQMVSQDGTSTYGYDSKSQLTSADHSYQSDETYTFDNNGNRTMTGYQTGTDNRLTNDGTYSYTYDAEGNRLTRTKTATGEVTEYTWDYHNRLTKVTEKNSQGTVTQVVEYVYDVFNRRIGRKIDTSAPFDMANAVIERYVLDDIHNGLTSADGSNVVLDFVDTDGSGAQAIAMSKRYLYGEAVDQLFAQEDLSKTLGDTSRNLWPLVDHLGTVRDLAKQDGTIATHFKYDSFGKVTSGDTSKTRYLFTSREFDTATKLQYNRARYYDAAVGRWISEDPLGFAAGDANVGRYVGNRVCEATDPSGLDWLDRYADWFWGIPDFFQDIYGSGETLSDPSSPVGQLICGDIYGNQIWGDPGAYINVQGGSWPVPTPFGTMPVHVGGGIEIIYDWGNTGTPGTGWNIYVYPQLEVDNSQSVSIGFGLLQAYNFDPPRYQGSFVNASLSASIAHYGGPSLGISGTPQGIHDWGIGEPVTDPYTFYGGWNWATGAPVSADVNYQYYIWLNDPQGVHFVSPF